MKEVLNNLLLLSTFVLFANTFAMAQNPNCPDNSEVLNLTSLATEDGAIASINAATLTVGSELLQVFNTYNGGTTADEEAINDDHLTGCTGLKLGVQDATNGAITNITTTYLFSGLVDNVCFQLIDIDRNDEIIINAGNSVTTYSFDAGDANFTLLDQSGNSCIDYIGNNTFSSSCVPPEVNQNNTTRTAMQICFTKPVNQIELTFYDKGETGGGSYTVCDLSTCITALPIELVSFYTQENSCQAGLSWRTNTESNFSHFDIQKSTNGVNYITIATMDSEGNNVTGAEYIFTDNQLAANNYYRLKMVDNDGLFAYSDVSTVTTDCASGVSISNVFPNPVGNANPSIRFTSSINEAAAKLMIMDALSRTVAQQDIEITEGTNLINLDIADLNGGTYYIFLTGNHWQTGVVKFVKQ